MTVRRGLHDEAMELRISARLFLEKPAGRVSKPASRRAPETTAKAEVVAARAVRGKQLLLGELADPEGASDLAGAWVAMHRLLYEVDPAEAVTEWTAVVSAARRTLTVHLGGNFGDALDLLRYVADRFRKANGSSKSRMSWKTVFSASAVTDFRVARSRTK